MGLRATVFVWDDDGRPCVWMPDFYLTQFGIYLEVCGSKDFNYENRKRVFSKNGYSVIFLHVFEGMSLWEDHLKRYLHRFLSIRNQAFCRSHFKTFLNTISAQAK